MNPSLPWRVTRSCALALVPLVGVAAYVAGWPAALGVIGGTGIAAGSFCWLAAGSRRALDLFQGGRAHPLWLLGLALRHLSMFAVLAGLLWSGYVDPLALIVGLSLFPPVLIAQALGSGAADA